MLEKENIITRVRDFPQPKEGLIPVSLFDEAEVVFVSKSTMRPQSEESVDAYLVSSAVDYLTRLLLGAKVEVAFREPLKGASMMSDLKAVDLSSIMISKISGLDDDSIEWAIKLVVFDDKYKFNLPDQDIWSVYESVTVNEATKNNVRLMVQRSVGFFEKYGPVVDYGYAFSFKDSKYLGKGTGDFLLNDAVANMRVSTKGLDTHSTLTIYVHYLLYKHEEIKDFDQVQWLFIYNPRLNLSWSISVSKIPESVTEIVRKEVIGYP